MHLSQLPISLSELTISSPGASVSAAISPRKEAMNLPWVIRPMPAYVDEVVIVGGRPHDHTVDVARAREIDRFLSPLRHDHDFAEGSRYAAAGGSEDLVWLRNAGNRALTGAANIVFRSGYSGLRYGLSSFRRECLKVLNGLSRPPATCACPGSLTSPQPG